MRLAAVLLVALAPSCAPQSAASTPSAEAGGAVGSPCSAPDDCTGPTLCAYPADGGCDAAGRCVAVDPGCTTSGSLVCACDGTPVQLACIYGKDNSPAPLPSPAPTTTSTPDCVPLDASLE